MSDNFINLSQSLLKKNEELENLKNVHASKQNEYNSLLNNYNNLKIQFDNNDLKYESLSEKNSDLLEQINQLKHDKQKINELLQLCQNAEEKARDECAIIENDKQVLERDLINERCLLLIKNN